MYILPSWPRSTRTVAWPGTPGGRLYETGPGAGLLYSGLLDSALRGEGGSWLIDSVLCGIYGWDGVGALRRS